MIALEQPPDIHVPVLLAEAMSALGPRSGGRYLDGTFGGGGHTIAILEASAPDGRVVALDRDPDAVARASRLASEPRYAGRLFAEHASFIDLAAAARRRAIDAFDGILLDLGMSSFQLDEPERGFAFSLDGPLDMRFDPSSGVTAADLVNTLGEQELARIIWLYGEDPKSRRIASEIVHERQRMPIRSTRQLAGLVEHAVGGRRGKQSHPATRTFQALRIAVNEELSTLADTLPIAVANLQTGGRLAVIAFHSLEDRMVKQFFRRESAACICPPEQPVCTCGHIPAIRLVGKPVKAASEELQANPRSRSAVLRVAERLAASREDHS